MLESVDEVIGGSDGGFGGGCGGHMDFSWKPGKSVGDTFGSCFIGVDSVAPVVVHSRTKVPSVDAMGSPGFASVWFDVDEDAGTGGCHGSAVEVEGSED